uniref:SAP30-binding protein n=1 Tax=Lygus hesperus TaxID=30085 RepID=A0A146KUZ7_LYGHE
MAALQSLTEIYTDSEGEDLGGRSERRDTDSEENGTGTDNTSMSKTYPKLPTHEEAVTVTSRSSNLVSYLNDTVMSDEETEKDAVTKPEPMEVTSEPESPPATTVPSSNEKVSNTLAVELPPEPIGKCSNAIQEKIVIAMEKMRRKGHDMNKDIQDRKEFRNPSIYEKLIDFCGINEFGTNYAPQIYDPHKWNKSSYYDELAKVQKVEMDKREKERKTKFELLTGTAKKSANGAAAAAAAAAEEERKRKSKWDQVGLPGVGPVRPPAAAGLVTLTSSSTGTKSTVISAFGSLPKKPHRLRVWSYIVDAVKDFPVTENCQSMVVVTIGEVVMHV